jgi:hypothetical protein
MPSIIGVDRPQPDSSKIVAVQDAKAAKVISRRKVSLGLQQDGA